MNFSEALQAMNDGERVCRTESAPYQYFYVEDHKLYNHMGYHVKDFDIGFALRHEWQIYEEPEWEPEGGRYSCISDGLVSEHYMSSMGFSRPTKEQAEAARDKMRTFNRLLAWLDEHNEDEVTLNIETDDYNRLNLTFLGVNDEVVDKLLTDMSEGRVVL